MRVAIRLFCTDFQNSRARRFSASNYQIFNGQALERSCCISPRPCYNKIPAICMDKIFNCSSYVIAISANECTVIVGI